jgi:hypothetical protein
MRHNTYGKSKHTPDELIEKYDKLCEESDLVGSPLERAQLGIYAELFEIRYALWDLYELLEKKLNNK